jgi:hypothetical protein
VQQWNLSVEHDFKGTVLSVRYVGNHGVKELRAIDFNQIDIKAGGFLDDFLRARSNGNLSRAATGVFNPAYNPSISGSQPLTVFPLLGRGGNLTSSSVRPAPNRCCRGPTVTRLITSYRSTSAISSVVDRRGACHHGRGLCRANRRRRNGRGLADRVSSGRGRTGEFAAIHSACACGVLGTRGKDCRGHLAGECI